MNCIPAAVAGVEEIVIATPPKRGGIAPAVAAAAKIAGVGRVVTVGGAQVSEKHAGFIINRGGATASDILSLIKHVQARVKAQTGVTLETEIRLIG